ncbi:MAG: PQQ-dependent sugar dehydrogenase [Gemmatimonadota bacterium]
MTSFSLYGLAAAMALGLSCGDSGSPPQSDVSARLELVAEGLAFPVDLTAPTGDARLFIVEKGGRIRVVKNGTVRSTPFLDISRLVSKGGEQGLLGLTFHPQYATNGQFVVDYTDVSGNTVVARYRVSSDPDVADSTSGTVLLPVAQPYSNHNGGSVAFGPDGYLYIGLGDGGSGGDPQNHGQDRTDLLGSLLRIDPDHGSPYNIPATNPYAQSTQFRREVWSYGLRNPWRFSFDRQTGDLYIADVGQGDLEEVDVAPAGSPGGENYGWRIMEGRSCYNASTCNSNGLILPVLQYSHNDGCSITGGYVYRGQAVPALRGTYFYSDFCNGWIRSFKYQDGVATEQKSWPDLNPNGSVTSFGQDAQGEVYILVADGKVYRIAQ